MYYIVFLATMYFVNYLPFHVLYVCVLNSWDPPNLFSKFEKYYIRSQWDAIEKDMATKDDSLATKSSSLCMYVRIHLSISSFYLFIYLLWFYFYASVCWFWLCEAKIVTRHICRNRFQWNFFVHPRLPLFTHTLFSVTVFIPTIVKLL